MATHPQWLVWVATHLSTLPHDQHNPPPTPTPPTHTNTQRLRTAACSPYRTPFVTLSLPVTSNHMVTEMACCTGKARVNTQDSPPLSTPHACQPCLNNQHPPTD